MTTPRIRRGATSTDSLWTDSIKNEQGSIVSVHVCSEKMRAAAGFKAAWENARRLDYYARWGFVRRSDAADAWAVVGDFGEIEGYKSRTEEARHYEQVFRSGEDSWRGSNRAFFESELLPCIIPRELFEGPLLPWPEIERYAADRGLVTQRAGGRVELMGIPRTVVASGEFVARHITMAMGCRLTNFFIPQHVAPHFMVHDIRRPSRGSMFVNTTDGIPAFIFGPDADVDAGETLTIVVENVSGEERVFEAAFKAYVLEGPPSVDWVDPIVLSPFPILYDVTTEQP